MQFDCKVNIVDAIMGAGKTQSIMNYINASDDDEKFLVITPFLDEIKRYRAYCYSKNFKTPTFLKDNDKGSKLNDLKKLIDKGENIVSTHALFQKFDNELIDLCRAKNYTLIMDEVANVIEEYPLTKQDFIVLKNTYVDINPNTKQLIWKKEYEDYQGKFENEKRLCELGSLVCYGDSLMVWLFPIETFNSFRNIYILTYYFEMQMQKYYYDYYGVQYTYWSVAGNSMKTYHLIPYDKTIKYTSYDYSKLIHICEIDKLNMIGDRDTDLSFSWYNRNKNNASMKVLKNNLYNFFHNVRENKSNDNIWTTFKEYQNALKGKGYTKGYLPCNCRATNDYINRTSVAYLVNRYLNPFIKNFFTMNNISVDEDGFALSEMLQFIWRSAIREGKDIWVYIPSIRMRNLLKQWVRNNSTSNRE
nr:MAG TPA: Cas system-associated protein [Caudoviricetes sp.]